MEFFTLKEPYISASNVLLHTPLLYRLDAHSDSGSVVVTEHAGRPPYFTTTGPVDESRRLFHDSVTEVDPRRVYMNYMIESDGLPWFTLEVRSPEGSHHTVISGYSNNRVSFAMHIAKNPMSFHDDLLAVHRRLLDLGSIFYKMPSKS